MDAPPRTANATPRVSICLPTWNGEADLKRLLPKLHAQEFAGGFELRAIDSCSRDRSFELLRAAGARVRTIPQSEFRHGATRNLLAAEARGEILVFLSQDAEPVDERFLAALVAAFDDPRTAGAYARLLPRPEDDPLTARTALDQPEAQSEPRVAELEPGRALASLAPRARAELARFNDVASAIRASVFREIPFPDVDFGEDSAWAACALDAGWRLRFVPEAEAWHAHRYTPREAYRRFRADARFLGEVHGFVVRPGLFSVARGLAYEMRADVRFLWKRRTARPWRVLGRSLALRSAQVLGQYAGSRRARRAR